MLDDQGTRIAARFAALTTEDRRRFLERLYVQDLDPSEIPIIPASRDTALPVSFAQLRQWFLWQMDPGSTAYHINYALRLNGVLDVEAVRWTFIRLSGRHESLRTVFRLSSVGTVEQVLEPSDRFELLQRDASDELRDIAEMKAEAEARSIARTPFDLTVGPLLRVGLIRVSAEEHMLVVVLHHIVSDGWSMQILVEEFVELYRAHVEGREATLNPLPIQYADYAVWQRHWLEAGEQERQLAYWQQQLGDEHPVLQLPTDHPRSSSSRYQGAHSVFELPPDLVQGLHRRAHEQRATLFMVLLAGLQALLYRYTGLTDVRVGTNNANRHRPEIQGVVGFFINAQVIRSQVDGRMRLEALLAQVREAVVGAQEYQDLPFEKLVEALQPERSLHHTPLFQVLMNHQRQEHRQPGQLSGLTLQPYALGEQTAKFELMLRTTERADGRVGASFTYAAELFEPQTISRLGEHYLKVLTALAEYAQQRIGEMTLLSRTEEEQLRQWGIQDLRTWSTPCVYELLEDQVKIAREATALISGMEAVSYGELSARASELARRLIALGVQPETRVGVHGPRSIEFVVGLLAVWKAGGVYVPLDPQLPAQRLAYQLKDSGARVLLSTSAVDWAEDVPVIDLAAVDEWAALDEQDLLLPEIHPSQPAYVIYTSGSTGQPKGVVVSHGALSNYVHGVLETLSLPEQVRYFAMVSTVSADLGHTVLFGALCSGRTLHLIPQECVFDPDRFADYMREHRIEVLKIVPSHLQGLLSAAHPEEVLPEHTLILGGEATPWPLLERIRELKPSCRVINHYGPTETTVGVLTHEAQQKRLESAETLPIGTALPNTQGYVLDADLNPTPQGVAGELYLGGAGLAQGYQGRSDLTAERFIASAFKEGERLYRTGDRVRVLKDGSMEFLGRMDDQVKVRGYRVELKEIANTLKAQPGVRAAEVIARTSEDGRVQLHGYVVPQATAVLDPQTLQALLAVVLPEYMVPSAIVVLEALPLTANGKLDRKALPAPGRAEDRYEAPHGEIEEILAGIWSKLLGVDRVGRHDNFFELGGDSMVALRFIARAHRHSIRPTLEQLFEHQTLSVLAEVLARYPASEPQSIPALPLSDRSGRLGPSPANPDVKLRVRDLMQDPTIATLPQVAAAETLSSRAMVKLNRSISPSAPLFCVHPGLGTVFSYLPLARYLERLRTVYGIVCRTHIDPSFRDSSIEQMARDYYQMIRQVQPQGPYYLLGWSFGGMVAWLMASIFEDNGEEVSFLGLVDSSLPMSTTDQTHVLVPQWRESLKSMIGVVAPAIKIDDAFFDGADDPFTSSDVLADLLDKILSDRREQLLEDYAGMNGADLANIFMTYRSLRPLRRRHVASLVNLKVRPHCWWASERGQDKKNKIGTYINAPGFYHYHIDATHMFIVKDERLINSVTDMLPKDPMNTGAAGLRTS